MVYEVMFPVCHTPHIYKPLANIKIKKNLDLNFRVVITNKK